MHLRRAVKMNKQNNVTTRHQIKLQRHTATQHSANIPNQHLSIRRFRFQLSIDKQYVNHHRSNAVRMIELDLWIAVICRAAQQK